MNLDTINKIHLKGQHDRADKLYAKAFEKGERSYLFYYFRGTLNLQRGEFGKASDDLKESVRLKPDFPGSYVNLTVALRQLNRVGESLKIALEGIERFTPQWDSLIDDIKNKRVPMEKVNKVIGKLEIAGNLLSNAGSSLIELGRNEEAIGHFKKALVYKPDHNDAHWNKSLAYLSLGRFAHGWPDYNWGFRTSERQSRPYADEIPEWIGQPLKDKTVLVWGEQGLGDEIIFAGCIPDIEKMAGQVYIDAHPRLAKIFERSFPKCKIFGTRKDMRPELFDDYEIDYHVPLGSLPNFFRRSLKEFPDKGYLVPDNKRVAYWKKRIGGKKRIGISWRGGAQKTAVHRRSIPLERFSRFLGPDVEWVSLQYGNVYEEIQDFEKKHGVHIHHYEGALEDYTETANLVASCDLIISVITAVIHLAGAMDIPTWCLVPQAPPWKFLPGERLPWHPSVRQYHQHERGNWNEAFKKVAADLREWK